MPKEATYKLVTLTPEHVPQMLRELADARIPVREMRETLEACALALEGHSIAAELQAMQTKLDALGIAIADAGYRWTPAMREAYESAPNARHKPRGEATSA